MLRSLTSDKESFKDFTFREGLNIVLADRVFVPDGEASPERRTRNGAGKSSLIDLVHFLLAGGPEGALKSKALQDWSFILSLDVGPEVWTIERGLSEKKSITRTCEPAPAREISATALAQQLGQTWFHLNGSKATGGASFRQLISYFARRRRDGGYDSPIRTFRAQSNAVSETNLAILFGLDAEIVRRLHQAKAALKQTETAQKTLRDLDKTAPKGARRVDLEAQLSAQIVAATLARDHLRTRIDAFNVLPAFRELEQELAKLNRDAGDLSDEDVLDRESIAANRRALESEDASRTTQLELLFSEANVVFPTSVSRRYEEVAQFHKRLIENRQSHLQNEIAAAELRIAARRTDREAIEIRRRQITAALRSSGPADELLRLRDELSTKEADVRGLEARLQEAQSLEERAEGLSRTVDESVRALKQDRRERSAIVDHASRLFSEISERLYETPGRLAISATEHGLRFVPETPSDQSAGVMSMEIFCFDLTIASLCQSKGLGPGFLIHDSHLFEPVDGRQFAKALRIAADFANETKIQYIVTLNSDELARAETESGENFREFVIDPVLSDAPDGGLFGFRFD
ncbi:MAG: DUF2326 domain-containing protein [Methylocystis sp.]